MARRYAISLGLIGAGFVLGLVVPNTLYIYGDKSGEPYRVNRFTGVQQFSSGKGWISEGDTDAKIEPEIARFNERLDQMRLASENRTLRKVDIMGRQVTAYYADGHKEEYYASDLGDPRLNDAQGILNKVAMNAPTIGFASAIK